MTLAPLSNITRRLRCSQFSPKSSSHSEREGYGHQWWGALEFRLALAVTHINAAGPVAESVKNQTEKTSNEFSGLANAARTPPAYTAATGQNLTRKKCKFL